MDGGSSDTGAALSLAELEAQITELAGRMADWRPARIG
jgi:hypothetical protein